MFCQMYFDKTFFYLFPTYLLHIEQWVATQDSIKKLMPKLAIK
jgi:hypothetical protein